MGRFIQVVFVLVFIGVSISGGWILSDLNPKQSFSQEEEASSIKIIESASDGRRGDPGRIIYTTEYRGKLVKINSTAVERQLHKEINRIRRSRGLSQLKFSTEIASVARAHSYDMAKRNFFAHKNPDGEMPWERFGSGWEKKCPGGYGENLAKNYVAERIKQSGKVVINTNEKELARSISYQLMHSKKHREQILMKKYDAEGVGVYITSNGTVYATQNFCAFDK